MAAIISLKSIQQVVSSLPYPSAKSLKSRLIQAVMQYYEEADTVRTLQFIPSEALIQKLWPTANNPDLIRKKTEKPKQCALVRKYRFKKTRLGWR